MIKRFLHVLPNMPFKLKQGLAPFLSQTNLDLIIDEHSNNLNKINCLINGTDFQNLTLFQIVQKTKNKLEYSLLHHYASQCWNMDFYLQGLRSSNLKDEPILPKVLNIINKEFENLDNFKFLVLI